MRDFERDSQEPQLPKTLSRKVYWPIDDERLALRRARTDARTSESRRRTGLMLAGGTVLAALAIAVGSSDRGQDTAEAVAQAPIAALDATLGRAIDRSLDGQMPPAGYPITESEVAVEIMERESPQAPLSTSLEDLATRAEVDLSDGVSDGERRKITGELITTVVINECLSGGNPGGTVAYYEGLKEVVLDCS